MSLSSCFVSLPGCSVARGDDTFLRQVFSYRCAYYDRNVQPLTRWSPQYGSLYFFSTILLFRIAGELVDDIMAVNWGTKFKASPRLVLVSLVIELWLLTLYSIAIAGLAFSLYSHGLVDSTMSAGVLFSFIGVSYYHGPRSLCTNYFAVYSVAHLCLIKLATVETIPLS